MPLIKDDFEHLMNQARVELTGSSDAGLKATFFDTLMEFFTDSNAWHETLTVNAVPKTQTYALVPQQGGKIIRLVGVFDPNLLVQDAFMPDFGTLTLVHPYSNPITLSVIVAKTVVRPTTRDSVPDAPDWTLSVFYSYVLDGLIGKMMAQAGKTYSNQPASSYHLKRFRTGIQMARTAVMRQNTFGAQSWRFPKSANAVGSQRGGISTGYPTAF
jgi:hypothetical protein